MVIPLCKPFGKLLLLCAVVEVMGLECNARGELSLEVSLLLQQGAETAQQLPRRVGADGRVPCSCCSSRVMF